MTARPSVVAHVITRLDVGGAQETAVRICAGLDRHEFTPVILCGADTGSGGSLRPAAAEAGVEVVELPTLPRGPIRPWADARAVAVVRAELRSCAATVVHTHSSKAGVVGRLAAPSAGAAAVVHTVHGWSFNDEQPAPVAAGYRAIERAMARRTDALVVVTTHDRDVGLAAGIGRADQYALVRSGIGDEGGTAGSGRDGRARFGWLDDEVVIVSVGRLEAQKDPLALVQAFAGLAVDPPRRLVLVGDGSLAGAVRDEAAALGVAGTVDVLGLRDDVADLLAAADLFALSSRWEGLPRAVLEATRAGLPVVATDTGGVREVIEDGVSGWLVAPGDVVALRDALAEAMSDPAQAHQRAHAAAQALPTFTEAAMVAATEELYRSLIAGRGVPTELGVHSARSVG